MIKFYSREDLFEIPYNSAVRHGTQEAYMEEKRFSRHVLIMFDLHTDHSSSWIYSLI